MNSKGCCLLIDRHFKRILNLMPDAVYISSRQGETLFVNSKWEDLTGISALDVLGKNVRDLITEGIFNHIVNPEAVAQKIHRDSLRKDKQFLTIDCSAIAETLIESEWFGYAPGAFSGTSSKGKKGFFEQASGGTLFLDEIGELQPRSSVPVNGSQLQDMVEDIVRQIILELKKQE